mgnify:CR=1 FL=1
MAKINRFNWLIIMATLTIVHIVVRVLYSIFRIRRVYIAGPFGDRDLANTADNIRIAMDVRASVHCMNTFMDNAYYDCVCVHSECSGLELDSRTSYPVLPIEHWYRRDLIAMMFCNRIRVLVENPRLEASRGTAREIEIARRLRIPIYHTNKEIK